MPDIPDVPEPDGDDMEAQEIELVFGRAKPLAHHPMKDQSLQV